MSNITIEAGTPEYVALKLLEKVYAGAMNERGQNLNVTEYLALYSRCLDTVKPSSGR